jgi:hypothetical protein
MASVEDDNEVANGLDAQLIQNSGYEEVFVTL